MLYKRGGKIKYLNVLITLRLVLLRLRSINTGVCQYTKMAHKENLLKSKMVNTHLKRACLDVWLHSTSRIFRCLLKKYTTPAPSY